MKKTTAATYSDCKGCFRGRFSRSQGNKVGNSTISSLIVKVQLFPQKPQQRAKNLQLINTNQYIWKDNITDNQ